MPFLTQILVSLVLMAVAYLLMPKPKSQSPNSKDMDDPTASAGSPVKVVYGTITIKDPNILWFGDKQTHTFKVKP